MRRQGGNVSGGLKRQIQVALSHGSTVGRSILEFGVAAILEYMLYRGTHHLALKSFFTVMSINL